MNESEKRYLPDVVARILALLPIAEEWASLRIRLDSISTSATYCPPEHQRQWWGKLCEALYEFLPQPPAMPWQVEVGEIVRGER